VPALDLKQLDSYHKKIFYNENIDN
jgi:hypothetical protein